MKRAAKWAVAVLSLLLVLVIGFFAVATITEFRPKAIEPVTVKTLAGQANQLRPGDQLTLITFNIGYAGLGQDQDFFMDGGHMVQPPKPAVQTNLDGIYQIIAQNPAQVYFIQEVDVNSRRSYGIDQRARFDTLDYANSTFAFNFKSMFTPYPWPPIGKVQSGLQTLTNTEVSQADRYALTVPFSWPVRLFNLKRCLLVQHVPLPGGQELVLINFHLEAYESGEGRAKQLEELISVMQAEFAQGNYVIAGGDFNSTLPGVDFPVVDTTWQPGTIQAADLPAGWSIANDPSAPTSRLNNHPLTGDLAQTQLFGIDGFITSPNVQVDTVTTLDQGFVFADHNPVKLTATLAVASTAT